MADPTPTHASVKIMPEQLATSAAKIRQELIKVPILSIGQTLSYFTLRPGIRYSETVGELSGTIEMGPHDPYRVDTADVKIAGRTLYTFFGSVVKPFDPNSVAQSVYGSSIIKGEGLKNVPIVAQVLSFLAGKIGAGLRLHLFDAVRDASGKRTVDLFNGFDTITAKEITDGGLSTAKGNLYEFTEAIDDTSAVELLRDFCRSAADELLEQEDGQDAKGSGLNLMVPRSILYAYRDDYKATTGNSPIYDKFNQICVEGFENIRLVPFAGKAKSRFIQLSTKGNMLVGCNLTGEEEQMTVEKHHPFLLDFVAAMFFGCEFESISPERLLVGKLKTAETQPAETPGGKQETENP